MNQNCKSLSDQPTQQPAQTATSRVRGLDYLRGLAALLVLYAHVIVVGGTDTVTPQRYFPMIDGTPLPVSPTPLWQIAIAPEQWLDKNHMNTGHIGVGVFFLISGYVILRLLDEVSGKAFFIGRFFRVIPLAMIVTLGTSVVFASYLALHGSQTYDLGSVMLSLALLPTPRPPNPVIWSLAVEVWFYAVIGLATWLFYRLELRHLVGISYACLAICMAAEPVRLAVPYSLGASPAFGTFIWTTAYNMVFTIFILIGSAIYRAVDRQTPLHGTLATAAIAIAFVFAFRIFQGNFSNDIGFGFSNAAASLVIFLAFLAFGRKFSESRWLSFFAKISYPLYLIHVPLAWIVLFLLTRHGIDGLSSVISTLIICISLAYFLHVFIERPFHKIGKSWAIHRARE